MMRILFKRPDNYFQELPRDKQEECEIGKGVKNENEKEYQLDRSGNQVFNLVNVERKILSNERIFPRSRKRSWLQVL